MKVDYAALDAKIGEFFKTGIPPVPNAETLEIFAFMDAAQRSEESWKTRPTFSELEPKYWILSLFDY